MRKVFFVLGMLFISACQKKTSLNHFRWSSKSKESRSKPSLKPNLFTVPDNSIKLFDELIENYKQKVGGAIVDSSYLQKVSNSQGELQFLNAQYEDQSFDFLKREAEKLYQFRFAALELMKKKYTALQTANFIFEPEVHITAAEAHPQLQYQFQFIPHDSNGVYSMRVSPSYQIESVRRVEKCFQESRSFIFPLGPRLSQLIETLLTPLLGDGSLTSLNFSISSLDGKSASAQNGEFVYSPEDSRFDQVQAFFFAQKTLNYAETHWDLVLPFPLKIELNAGYPEKTDLMYYHKRVIRLGTGNLSYKNIPRDPSIVTHEIAHALIDVISSMESEGEAGSLNEGFADYITASIWEIPELGHTANIKRPFTRTVEVKTLFSERNGGTYHDSGIVSGTLWELEKQLGAEKTQKLALKAIARLGVHPLFEQVFPAIMDAAQSSLFNEKDVNLIKSVFFKRGWPNL